MTDDEQRLESLEGMQRSNFMLHYNFPPFSVGERGRIGTGRREIGHGKLAWAINSSLPKRKFSLYIKSSFRNNRVQWILVNGDSLWNFFIVNGCGVPIKEPVAGIAMGLIKEGELFRTFWHFGGRDHLGDMDFKVAGTKMELPHFRWILKLQVSLLRLKKPWSKQNWKRTHIKWNEQSY